MVLIIGGAYQGKDAYAREHFPGCPILSGYHEKVREQMLSGQDPMEEARKLVLKDQDLVVVSDEIGYGLIPMDAFERAYREMDGRVHCYLAKEAKQVIRVTCGIGVRIK